MGGFISGLTYGSPSLQPVDLLAPPCRSRLGFHPADGDFYLRAFDGLVARSAAGYHYRDNWAIFSGGSFPARTPTSIAATAHRTGQADFPHPALGKDAHQRTKLWHVTPSTTSEHNRGVSRLIVNPRVLCCVLRPSLTEAPSLHRHYPASSVLRASPSPHTARPDSHELPVDPNCDHRWGFPCCYWSTLHVCRRHYPGRSAGTRSLVLFHQRRPSQLHGGLAPALIVSRPAQLSLHVTASMLAKSPK